MRELIFTDEFWSFYHEQQEKRKFHYVMDIVRTEAIISTKFVKHLENTDLYEMRASV